MIQEIFYVLCDGFIPIEPREYFHYLSSKEEATRAAMTVQAATQNDEAITQAIYKDHDRPTLFSEPANDASHRRGKTLRIDWEAALIMIMLLGYILLSSAVLFRIAAIGALFA